MLAPRQPGEHGTAFVFRCQVKTDAWKPGDRTPFKGVDGWNLLEVTVRDGEVLNATTTNCL